MSQDDQVSSSEALEALTGYDEQKIEARFKAEVLELGGVKFLRALIFGDQLHNGKDDEGAYKAAMELTVKQVQAYFSSDPEDALPDAPDTEAGKDDSSAG